MLGARGLNYMLSKPRIEDGCRLGVGNDMIMSLCNWWPVLPYFIAKKTTANNQTKPELPSGDSVINQRNTLIELRNLSWSSRIPRIWRNAKRKIATLWFSDWKAGRKAGNCTSLLLTPALGGNAMTRLYAESLPCPALKYWTMSTRGRFSRHPLDRESIIRVAMLGIMTSAASLKLCNLINHSGN